MIQRRWADEEVTLFFFHCKYTLMRVNEVGINHPIEIMEIMLSHSEIIQITTYVWINNIKIVCCSVGCYINVVNNL